MVFTKVGSELGSLFLQPCFFRPQRLQQWLRDALSKETYSAARRYCALLVRDLLVLLNFERGFPTYIIAIVLAIFLARLGF